MNFDYIIGNPPFQNSKANGSNKKLWKEITRKVEVLFKRQMVFITPQAQAQYINQNNTFYLDYTIQDFFDVGVRVMAWGIQNSPALLKTFSSDGTIDSDFYNHSERQIAEEFINLKSTPADKKLFKRQSCGKGKLRCVKNHNKNTTDICIDYVIPDGHKKLAISTSGALKRDNVLIGYEHYGSLYAQIDINDWSDKKIQNFIGDLLSPEFVEYCEEFKKYFGTGFNNVLIYTDSLQRVTGTTGTT